jgi:hypothetical protein
MRARRRLAADSLSKKCAWVVRQLREAFPYDSAPRDLIFDRGASFNEEASGTVNGFGIEPKRTYAYEEHGMSELLACGLAHQPRGTQGYQLTQRDDGANAHRLITFIQSFLLVLVSCSRLRIDGSQFVSLLLRQSLFFNLLADVRDQLVDPVNKILRVGARVPMSAKIDGRRMSKPHWPAR